MDKEACKMKAELKKEKVYDQLMACTRKTGLNLQDLSNLQDCYAKLRANWDLDQSIMMRFITFLETLQEQWTLEQRLVAIQNARLQVSEQVVATPNQLIALGSNRES